LQFFLPFSQALLTILFHHLPWFSSGIFLSLTCHKIGMMKLANGIGLEPGYAIAEEAIEDIETLLRHCPGVAHVHL